MLFTLKIVARYALSIVLAVLITIAINPVCALGDNASDLARLSGVAFWTAAPAHIVGSGVVIGNDANVVYVLTNSHVLHSGLPYCGTTGTQDPAPTQSTDFEIRLVNGNALVGTNYAVIADNRCLDVAVVAVTTTTVIPQACFLAGVSTGQSIELIEPVKLGEQQTQNGETDLIQFEVASGQVKAVFPALNVLAHTAAALKGSSGAGVIDSTSGALVGIQSSGPEVSETHETTWKAVLTTGIQAALAGNNAGVAITIVPDPAHLPSICYGIGP